MHFRLYYQNHLILMHELIFQALHQAQFQKINGECLVSTNSVDIQCNGFDSLKYFKDLCIIYNYVLFVKYSQYLLSRTNMARCIHFFFKHVIYFPFVPTADADRTKWQTPRTPPRNAGKCRHKKNKIDVFKNANRFLKLIHRYNPCLTYKYCLYSMLNR